VVLALIGGGDPEQREASERLRIVTSDRLEKLEASLGHPVYWAGRRPSFRLELSEEADGSVYLRYLPAEAAVGSRPGYYLTVGTYPMPNPRAAIRSAAEAAGERPGRLPGGASFFADGKGSVFLAPPGAKVQVEVYDPDPRRASAVVESGEVRPVSS